VSRNESQRKRPSLPEVSASSIGSTASLRTSQKRKSRIPVAMAARKAFVPAVTFCIRPSGRPRKIVNPAIAPSRRVWPVLM
jgi:hypothetical protein